MPPSPSEPPSPPPLAVHLPHSSSPLSTVRHTEFSPFDWRLGFIWKADRKPVGRRALRRGGEEKLRCGRPEGDCERTGNRGLDFYFILFFSPPWLSPVCERSAVGRHGGAVCCVGAPTVPTAGLLVSAGKTDLRRVYAPAPLSGFLMSIVCI